MRFFNVENSLDYYSFGMLMPKRFGGGGYRYSFQGQEADNEVKGNGNSVNYKYRMHDARLGSFFAIDPLASKYPHNSVYAFSENVVINAVELEGLERVAAITFGGEKVYGQRFPKLITINSTKVEHKNLDANAGINGLVGYLIDLTSRDDEGIGFLAIFTHGAEGQIFPNYDEDLNPEGVTEIYTHDLSKLKEAIDKGDIKFAKGAKIYMGCL